MLHGRQLYVCVGCNTPLFTSKDIIEHNSSQTTASSSGRANLASKTCTSFFIKQREWMPNYGTSEFKPKGTLECYRKVCKRKVGQFCEQGLRCNCGKMIKPGNQILKNRVKLVGANSTTVHLGSSGNSMTNLQSNSDLGKY